METYEAKYLESMEKFAGLGHLRCTRAPKEPFSSTTESQASIIYQHPFPCKILQSIQMKPLLLARLKQRLQMLKG